MTFASLTAVGVKAMVAPPASGNAWSYYTLAVCEKDAATTTCLPVPGSPFNCTKTTGSSTECPITGAKAQTTYTVAATAHQADDTPSAVSTATYEFTTPQHA